jgi:hypothetical protein
MTTSHLYKVIFYSQGKIYEVYARNIHQSGMFGFLEIENLVFGTRSSVVVDPSEEQIKSEFNGVNRTYIPLHSVIRIDEVEKEGKVKVTAAEAKANIMPFPVYTQSEPGKS